MLNSFRKLNTKKRELTVFFILLVAVFLFSFNFAHAQSPELGINYAANLGLQEATEKDPRDFIVNIIKYFITFLGIIAVVMVMYSGFLWMTSDGDPEKVNNAKRTLINSVVGLIVILFSFAIVTFVANLMNGGGGGGGLGDGRRPHAPYGYGAIGACSVESVYPEPNQKDVPRDTGIIITFKEEVDINTMADVAGNIDTDHVKIFYTQEAEGCISGGTCSSLVTAATIFTNDNKTFFIQPTNYLGSPSEYIWHSVYLNNSVEKLSDGSGIFTTCQSDFLRWDFEVSNHLDLIPPQVKNNGVFPDPDNIQDGVTETLAVQATGTIEILNSPLQAFIPASVGAVSKNPVTATWSNVTVDIGDVCSEPGTYTVDVSASNSDQASLRRGTLLLGSAETSGDYVNFQNYCNIYLTLDNGTFDDGQCDGGCVWDFTIAESTEADTLRIGSDIYEFGDDIPIGSTRALSAQSLMSFINGTRSDLIAHIGSNSNIVILSSTVAGTIGNNILLSTNNSTNLEITPMSGGVDTATTYDVKDARDKARNAVIQINFNEAINPLVTSGLASDLVNYIRVKCFENDGTTPCSVTGPDLFVCDSTNACVNGHFEISNQYKTVEFISDNQCGVNSCGEDIYCLPGNTNLVVEVEAADLLTCPPTDCTTKSPYNNCNSNFCQNADNRNLPKASSTLNGIIDMSNNSLDGNRDTFASGSLSFYDENHPDIEGGDSYQWSFYINNLIDIGAPTISALSPGHADDSVGLEDPVEISFSKLMMSSSLKTGQTEIFNGQDYFRHKCINLWNFANLPLGYWISSENIDTSSPLDGVNDETKTLIKHSSFYEVASYRAQVGSGVKDIYQNCFKPSVGPAGTGCTPDDALPNCCASTTEPTFLIESGDDRIDAVTGNCN